MARLQKLRPVSRLNECYQLRSDLAHGKHPRPSRAEVDERRAAAEFLLSDLLSADLSGASHGRAGRVEPPRDALPPRRRPLRLSSAAIPFYDTTFNRVLVTVTRPDECSRVYELLKDRLTTLFVPQPDEQGRIDIGIDQERSDVAAEGIRTVLDREWPDSADWILVEPTPPPPPR